MRGRLIGLLAAAAIADPAAAEEGPLPKEFEAIETDRRRLSREPQLRQSSAEVPGCAGDRPVAA